MYRAHSKNINRNKSFHPLTYGNLRKVEVIQEKQEEEKKRHEERNKELLRDQEERRYDELVLASSADGQSGQLGDHKRRARGIFAAEYEAEARRVAAEQGDGPRGTGTGMIHTVTTSANASLSLGTAAEAGRFGNFMNKFKKDESSLPAKTPEGDVKVKEHASASHSSGIKRAREEEGEQESESATVPVTTGHIGSSESVRLRKELDLLKKQSLDPLRKIKQFENRTVAAAAATREREEKNQKQMAAAAGHGVGGSSSEKKSTRDAIQERISLLMERKKAKK